MQSLYQTIPLRKSSRKYDMTPLDNQTLDEISHAIEGFTPLTPDAPLTWRFVTEVKGLYHINAPHYLIISGTGAAHEKEHAGFLFQQLILWLDTRGLGSVWLGESKDTGPARSQNDIITIGFGKVTEPLRRTIEEFKRKPISDITNTPDDICIKAAHLAPSGMNTQPWYFESQNGRVLVYRQKLKPPLSLLYKHSDIDMGIALCHYCLACAETGKAFSFTRSDTLPGKSGYAAFGIIE